MTRVRRAIGLGVVGLLMLGTSSAAGVASNGDAANRRAVVVAAHVFAQRSGCRVSVAGVTFAGTVTGSGSGSAVARVVGGSAFANVRGGRCTGVVTLAAARRAGHAGASALQRYLDAIRPRVTAGTQLFRILWRPHGKRRFTTLAIASGGSLIYDPLVSTFLRHAPKAAPAKPEPTPAQPGLQRTVSWNPFPHGGCLARDVIGTCHVRQFVNMFIFVDGAGHVSDEAETATISPSLANAERRVKRELIDGGACEQLTVQTFWTSPLGVVRRTTPAGGFDTGLAFAGVGPSGTYDEAFVLCADGSGRIV